MLSLLSTSWPFSLSYSFERNYATLDRSILLAESTWSFEEKQKENPEMPQATTSDAIVIGTREARKIPPHRPGEDRSERDAD
jgi:hypothetical protein